jgi:hypothetical protein
VVHFCSFSVVFGALYGLRGVALLLFVVLGLSKC